MYIKLQESTYIAYINIRPGRVQSSSGPAPWHHHLFIASNVITVGFSEQLPRNFNFTFFIISTESCCFVNGFSLRWFVHEVFMICDSGHIQLHIVIVLFFHVISTKDVLFFFLLLPIYYPTYSSNALTHSLVTVCINPIYTVFSASFHSSEFA